MDVVIRAAGVVLIRHTSRGPRILMVHRPRRKDWSLPKGKLDKDEHVVAAAVRECDEETGIVPVLGVPMGRHSYKVLGRPKTVDYWVAEPGQNNGFAPDDEVDEIMWVGRRQALAMLSYKRDAEMVDEALAMPRTSPLILLRHSAATKRGEYRGPDKGRPLTGRGRSQARSLIPLLSAFGVTRIVSSDAARCVQTVKPFADLTGARVEEVADLSEESFDKKPKAAVQAVLTLAEKPGGIVVCSHRPVLPALLGPLAKQLGKKPAQILCEPLRPGGMVVIHRDLGSSARTPRFTWKAVAGERHDGP